VVDSADRWREILPELFDKMRERQRRGQRLGASRVSRWRDVVQLDRLLLLLLLLLMMMMMLLLLPLLLLLLRHTYAGFVAASIPHAAPTIVYRHWIRIVRVPKVERVRRALGV
jgi:hypothetical protein